MSEGLVADSSVGVAWALHSQASNATDDLLDEALCRAAQNCRVKLLL